MSTQQQKKRGSGGGWNRLSPEEHMRRGTFQRVRHEEKKPPAPAELTALQQLPWLDGLPESARRSGWLMLKQFEPTDRDAFRQYLLSCGRAEAIPRRYETIDALQRANAEATQLLAELRYRQRTAAELEAAQAAHPGSVWP